MYLIDSYLAAAFSRVAPALAAGGKPFVPMTDKSLLRAFLRQSPEAGEKRG